MKCDLCESEATIHETTVRNGVKVERHLCERHAAEAGIVIKPSEQLGDLLKQVLQGPPTPAQGAQRLPGCPVCRTTFTEFRKTGLLGCPECYHVFEAQLGPLLERAHEGALRHAGKTPRRLLNVPAPEPVRQSLVDLEQRAERLRRLRGELDQAVKHEHYEDAARLRDELRKLASGEEGQA